MLISELERNRNEAKNKVKRAALRLLEKTPKREKRTLNLNHGDN